MNLEKSKQLLALSRKEPNARKRIRLLAVSLFFEGESRTNIAKRLNTARGSVNKWVSNYLNNGVAGLNNKPIKGRPAKLTSQQLNTLSDYLKQSASSSEGGILMGEDIAQYIYDQFNIRYGYLFGAVCPSNGKTEALISPIVNKEIMTQRMELISKATEAG